MTGSSCPLTKTQWGTFALYSLLCRHCNISALPNKHPTDEELTTFVVNCGSIKKTWLQKKLESSKVLQRILFIVVLCGTSMVIGDGILTPAISGNLFLLS
jgi:KUP system potassium uptake protein